MLSAPVKLAAFCAALVVLFGAGALAGGIVDPDRDEPAAAHATAAEPGHAGADAPRPLRGLGIAEDGLRLVVETPELRRDRSTVVRFRIADERGDTVRDFDVEHTKRMHLIVARRDLSGFQHLHPRQAADGSWSSTVRLAAAGSYRLFADFSHAGAPTTLASDLRVDGDADLRALPAPAATAVSDGGHHVRLDARRAEPGREAELRFTISRGGRAVHPQPYLGASGHLVALREGDLAFLHVHPVGEGRFAATFPMAGRYRLFLQFKDAGRVHTVAFTQEVAG
jgi:hypothetical protein